MGNRVAFADVGQKLVAQTLALGRAFDQTGDIHKGHARGDDLFGTGDFGQLIETRIGHRHVTDVRLNRAERKVRRLSSCGFGQRVKQRRFSNVGQTNDTCLEPHEETLFPVLDA